jgi:hypothetical protein
MPGAGLEKWSIPQNCGEGLQLKTNYEAETLIQKLFPSEPRDSLV